MVAILIAAFVTLTAFAAAATLVEAVRKGHRAVHAIARQLAELENPQPALRPRRVRAAIVRRPLRPAAPGMRADA